MCCAVWTVKIRLTATDMAAHQPVILGGNESWTGIELSQSSDWVHTWSHECVDELAEAVNHFKRLGLHWKKINRTNFPLKRTSQMLLDVADTLEHGRGIAKLTGLSLDGYSLDDLRILFYGVCHWLGHPVCQSNSGEYLGKICDEGADVGLRRGQMLDEDGKAFLSSQARTRSSQPLRWHTDRADVVGLLSVNTPASGGVSRVASAVAIHDEMIRRRPDLTEVLYREPVALPGTDSSTGRARSLS